MVFFTEDSTSNSQEQVSNSTPNEQHTLSSLEAQAEKDAISVSVGVNPPNTPEVPNIPGQMSDPVPRIRALLTELNAFCDAVESSASYTFESSNAVKSDEHAAVQDADNYRRNMDKSNAIPEASPSSDRTAVSPRPNVFDHFAWHPDVTQNPQPTNIFQELAETQSPEPIDVPESIPSTVDLEGHARSSVDSCSQSWNRTAYSGQDLEKQSLNSRPVSSSRSGVTSNRAPPSTEQESETEEEDLEWQSYLEDREGQSSLQSASPDMTQCIPRPGPCNKLSVPLRDWCLPQRVAPVSPSDLGVVEFWRMDSENQMTLGTRFSERYDLEICVLNEDNDAFPGKKMNALTLRILWPGYDDYSKKMTLTRTMSHWTVGKLRDDLYREVRTFIQENYRSNSTEPYWKVAPSQLMQPEAIHIDDLVLVRLRQVSKGSWVPEIELMDWDRAM